MKHLETIEERTMIQQYVLHEYMSSILDRDRERLKNERNILQTLFMDVHEAVFDRVHNVMVELRKEFKARNIEVGEGTYNDGVMYYDFWCRGYKRVFPIWRDHARTSIALKLGAYSTEVEKKLWAAR